MIERGHSRSMVDQTEQDEGLLSADAKPFLPQKAPISGMCATIPEDGKPYEYKTPVVVRLLVNSVPLWWFVGGSLQRQSHTCRSEYRSMS